MERENGIKVIKIYSTVAKALMKLPFSRLQVAGLDLKNLLYKTLRYIEYGVYDAPVK